MCLSPRVIVTNTLEYSDDAVGLAKKLLPLFALALDLREDFFVDKVATMLFLILYAHY